MSANTNSGGSGIGAKFKGVAQAIQGTGEVIRGETLRAIDGLGSDTTHTASTQQHASVADSGRAEMSRGIANVEGHGAPGGAPAGTGAGVDGGPRSGGHTYDQPADVAAGAGPTGGGAGAGTQQRGWAAGPAQERGTSGYDQATTDNTGRPVPPIPQTQQ